MVDQYAIALILVLLSSFLQESARFLLSMGRNEEAQQTMERYGIRFRHKAADSDKSLKDVRAQGVLQTSTLWITITFALIGLSVGFVNFGILLWGPGALLHEGRSIENVSRLLAQSTLLACPTVVLVAWLYARWSSRRTLLVTILITSAGLFLILARNSLMQHWLIGPIVPAVLLIIGTNGLISVLLPYTAELYGLRVRGRATGAIAGFSKGGGLLAQVLGIFALVPALNIAARCALIPCVGSAVLLTLFGRETKQQDLRA